MSLHPKHYKLSVTFKAPLLSQATGTLALGVDAAMQCDNQGNPVLSGSLIRGNIRHTLEEFANLISNSTLQKYINSWFGKKSGANGDQEHLDRANIEFGFFWKLETEIEKTNQVRTRISIDDSGKVKDAALQVIEDRFPTGSGNITFTGKIVAHISDKEQADFEKWMNKALYYIPAMGSFKGIGFGKLENHRLELKESPLKNIQTAPKLTPDSTRLNIQLELDNPFCIGRPKTPRSNRIISSKYITGNVIKGVISRAYNRVYQDKSKTLKAELSFDELIISHAIPILNKETRQNSAPLNNPPLSLAILGNEIIDFADPQTTKKYSEVPRFAPDWKQQDQQKINNYCGIHTDTPKRYLSVKTGINAQQGTSETGQLFSLDCVDPTGFVWNAEIELCNIAEEKRQTVVNNLQALFNQGLYGIGKTKANARITLQTIPPNIKAVTKTSYDDNIAIIDLVSEAKMLPVGLQIPATNSAKQLHIHYQDYFHQIDANIKLDRYFARQTMASSYHHQKRYNQAPHYQPDYLTNAGSVFVLKLNSQQAKDKLTQCLKTGLPAHKNTTGDEATWESTPYLPEHGYGHICLHKKKITGAKV